MILGASSLALARQGLLLKAVLLNWVGVRGGLGVGLSRGVPTARYTKMPQRHRPQFPDHLFYTGWGHETILLIPKQRQTCCKVRCQFWLFFRQSVKHLSNVTLLTLFLSQQGTGVCLFFSPLPLWGVSGWETPQRGGRKSETLAEEGGEGSVWRGCWLRSALSSRWEWCSAFPSVWAPFCRHRLAGEPRARHGVPSSGTLAGYAAGKVAQA